MRANIPRWSALAMAVLCLAGCPSDGDVSCSDGVAPETFAGTWWQPGVGTTWQWQLTGTVDSSVDVEMYDIDLFDTPKSTIEALQADGRVVICYFSAGTYEDWRPDRSEFTSSDYGKELREWPGEYWVDTRSANVRRIMMARLDMAVEKGCDGVEPDNMGGYGNKNGLDLQCLDQLDYNRFIAAEAHKRELSVGLKNAVAIAGELEPHYDWALNEECHAYDECALLQPFLDAEKAVFHTEYVKRQAQGAKKRDDVCGHVPAGFSTLVKLWDLDAWYLECP